MLNRLLYDCFIHEGTAHAPTNQKRAKIKLLMLRFAPSPTGLLHIGNARIALLNYLYCVKYQKQLILRIDDTDATRNTNTTSSLMREDLEWLGVKFNRCYSQSECSYDKEIDQLKSNDLIYACYETPEELEEQKALQRAARQPPRYIPCARDFTRVPHWRFRLTDSIETWDDLIMGRQSHRATEFSDPVVIREDSTPTYTLTSVLNDIRDKVSCIMRGADHISNTAVQQQLFRALGADPGMILFAHTPLISAAHHTLSKRDLNTHYSLQYMRAAGYEPLALAHALVEIGYPSPVKYCTNLEELAAQIDFTRYSKSNSNYDPNQYTKWLKAHRRHCSTEYGVRWLRVFFPDATSAHWTLLKDAAYTSKDALLWRSILEEEHFWVAPNCDTAALIRKYADEHTTHDLNTLCNELPQYTKKQIGAALRHALIGMEDGPRINDIAAVLTQQQIKHRIAVKHN